MKIQHKKTLLASLISVALGLSVNVSADSIELTGTVRDFKASHPDFETKIVGHQTACVENSLGEDSKPVLNAKKSKDCAITQFTDWYNDSEASQSMALTLELKQGTGAEADIYTYDSAVNPLTQIEPANGGFFPIDNQLFGNENNKHNYHFTFEGHGEFTYKKGQTFSFRGDDDVWIFIDKQLAVDIGGIHGAISRSVSLDNLDLTEGETYPLDLFFAERHTTQSNFKVQTSIQLQPPADVDNGIEVEPLDVPAILEITQPTANDRWHVVANCDNPFITVKGKAALKELQPIDLALLIDTSGSTEKKASNDKTVLDTERLAAHALIDMLEATNSDILVSLTHFARESKVLSPLTNDWAALRQAIDGLTVPDGGTNMASGIENALSTLDSPRDNARKTILMITDGIPTLPVEGGLTQQRGDRKATLDMAKTAAKANTRIYPIVIDPDGEDRTLTTMPAVRAITGVPNTVPNLGLDNIDQLAELMKYTSLTDVSDVSVTNQTTGQTVVAKVSLGGEFSVDVPVSVGDNTLVVKAHAGNPDKAVTRTLVVPLLAQQTGDSQAVSCTVVAVPACKIYAIHDQGSVDTQFFTMTPTEGGKLGQVEKLGTMYKGHNIEGMDIHPVSQELIAVSSSSKGSKLYQVNPSNGEIKLLGMLKDEKGKEFREVASLSFRNDGTLWGVARHGKKDNRLISIDSKTAVATMVTKFEVSAGGIAWSNDGSLLWMVYGKSLYTWNPATDKVTKAFTVGDLPKVRDFEGLEFRPDGLLMLGAHTGGDYLSLFAVDPETGKVSKQDDFDTKELNDVEAMAWPEQCGQLPQ